MNIVQYIDLDLYTNVIQKPNIYHSMQKLIDEVFDNREMSNKFTSLTIKSKIAMCALYIRNGYLAQVSVELPEKDISISKHDQIIQLISSGKESIMIHQNKYNPTELSKIMSSINIYKTLQLPIQRFDEYFSQLLGEDVYNKHYKIKDERDSNGKKVKSIKILSEILSVTEKVPDTKFMEQLINVPTKINNG